MPRFRLLAEEPSPYLDRFGWLLGMVSVSLAGQALIDVHLSPVGAAISHVLSGAALMVAARVTGVTRGVRRAADLLVASVVLANIGLVVTQLTTGTPPSESRVGVDPLWLLAAALVPAIVLARLARHTVVRVATLAGALAAYLQIAVAYAQLYQAIDVWSETPLFGFPVPTTAYSYFSMVTIATLGYGDLAAVGALGRFLSASEAVVGQVFLVTIVAVIVSRLAARAGSGASDSRPRRDEEYDPPDTARDHEL